MRAFHWSQLWLKPPWIIAEASGKNEQVGFCCFVKASFRIEVGASVCDLSLRLLLAGTIFHAAALKRLTPSARRRCCGLLTREACWGAKVTLAVWALIHTHRFWLMQPAGNTAELLWLQLSPDWLMSSQSGCSTLFLLVDIDTFLIFTLTGSFCHSVIGWWEWLIVLLTKFSSVQNSRNSQFWVNDWNKWIKRLNILISENVLSYYQKYKQINKADEESIIFFEVQLIFKALNTKHKLA